MSFRVPRRHLERLAELLRKQRLHGPLGPRDFATNEEIKAIVLGAIRRNAGTTRAIQVLRERVCQDAESDANQECVGLNQSDWCDACAVDKVASRMTIGEIQLHGSTATCRVTIACEASGWCAERSGSPAPLGPPSPGGEPPQGPRTPRDVPHDPGDTIPPLLVALGNHSDELDVSLELDSGVESGALDGRIRSSADASEIVVLSQGTYSMFATPLSVGGSHPGAPGS